MEGHPTKSGVLLIHLFPSNLCVRPLLFPALWSYRLIAISCSRFPINLISRLFRLYSYHLSPSSSSFSFSPFLFVFLSQLCRATRVAPERRRQSQAQSHHRAEAVSHHFTPHKKKKDKKKTDSVPQTYTHPLASLYIQAVSSHPILQFICNT